MKGGLGKMMRQVQEMQASMQKMQEQLADMEVRGESGGGMVAVVMTGRHEVRRVQLDPALLRDDKEMVEDLLAAAVNDAVRKVEEAVQEKFAGLTGGLPGLSDLKLPF